MKSRQCQRPLLLPDEAQASPWAEPSATNDSSSLDAPTASGALATLTTLTPVPRAAVALNVDAYLLARGSLSEAEWHLLFAAVTCKLREACHQPALAAAILPECVAALDWLQSVVDTRQ